MSSLRAQAFLPAPSLTPSTRLQPLLPVQVLLRQLQTLGPKQATTQKPVSVRSSVWSQFHGFVPKPTARFNHEFERLCKHMKWTQEERRSYRTVIFNADWEAHMGRDLENLAKWQKFCRLCSIDPVPTTIAGCMEVLAKVLVNIYDLLDSQRTGANVLVFQDFEDFRKYTLNNRRYPLDEAKEDTFLPIFLKKVL
ncbi:uncharacterized protein J4E92_008485 [Alternaria infectoria]|uniref:uncharacterized protein n=1 Tax=Alternaria infectoria TaxID=45303 RepID=UPI00221FAB1E|nr:uncharacterized protein J4E92_008485 [Alternaria infectoria]KAI4920267.1 hypothetical protein J4E92_008485 [Alternaria infectoria]